MIEGCTPWPVELAEHYRRSGYWRGEPLGALLRVGAARHPDRTALVGDRRRLTYAELDLAADRMAAGLHRLGIRGGERVVVQLPNVPEFVVLTFALLRLGALPVYALPAHRESEISYLCRHSEAAAYVIPDQFQSFDHRGLARSARAAAPSLRHVLVAGEAGEFTPLSAVDAEPVELAEPPAAEVALFLLSGGTTGLPKLIPRTHDDYAYNVRASAEVCGLDESTVYLAALPAGHNFPLGCPGILGTLHAGGTVVMATSPSPDEAFPLIERERVTATALVPALAQLWIEAAEWLDDDISSLRLLQVGGAKLGTEVARQVRPALGCQLQQVFGMAEGLLNYTRLDDPPELVETTQGRPLSPDDELRVVSEDGADVRAGETGELLVRGPYTLRGYYRADEHNARAFTADGYYRSGDLVRRLPGGHLVVEGRVKETINRGGEKISADELETHLRAHPAIRDAAVVPMPDATLGERICAYVIADGKPPQLHAVAAFLRARGLATYKIPDRLEVVRSFPLTAVGKVSKPALTADLATKLEQPTP